MRGMNTRESVQMVIEAMRIYYNYCREHSTLQCTPAQNAGLVLNYKGNKIEGLIRLVSVDE
jgi:hypothetical protein